MGQRLVSVGDASSPERNGTMKKFHCLVCLASALALFPACSLITDFDPEGKPCDGLRRCEDGYYCRIEDETNGTGRCMKGKNPAEPSGFLSVSSSGEDVSSTAAAAGEEGAEEASAGDNIGTDADDDGLGTGEGEEDFCGEDGCEPDPQE